MFFSRLQSEVQSDTTVSFQSIFTLQYCQFLNIWCHIRHHCIVCKGKHVTVLPLPISMHITKYMKPLKCVLRSMEKHHVAWNQVMNYMKCPIRVLCGSSIRMRHLICGRWYADGTITGIYDLRWLQPDAVGSSPVGLSSRPAVACCPRNTWNPWSVYFVAWKSITWHEIRSRSTWSARAVMDTWLFPRYPDKPSFPVPWQLS